MTDSPPPAAIVSVYPAYLLQEYTDAATATTCFYEYIITFGLEYELFWKRKLTGAWVLFMLNRYTFLLNNVLGALYWMPQSLKVGCYIPLITALRSPLSPSLQTCMVTAEASSVVSALQYLPWAGQSPALALIGLQPSNVEDNEAFAGLRAFALSQSRLLGALAFSLSVIPFIIKFARIFLWHFHGAIDPIFGCGEEETSNATQGHMYAVLFDILIRACSISAEVIVVLVTWFTIYRRGAFRQRGVTLSSIVLLDGTAYFLVMLFLNILDMCFSLLTVGPNTAIQFSSLVTQFIEPITSILVSRFLLNLQGANRDAVNLTSRSPSQQLTSTGGQTLNFARIIGSLGSSLDFTESDDTYSEDDDVTHEEENMCT
ncbi:hypothetical protein C8Q74DRAFT_1366001 [Fomes fomentarius]|nr:hypothetical protein C8Q74DRAFT_1366001 [Fomes fomentarius]